MIIYINFYFSTYKIFYLRVIILGISIVVIVAFLFNIFLAISIFSIVNIEIAGIDILN